MAARQKKDGGGKAAAAARDTRAPAQDRHRHAAARCRHGVQPLSDRAARRARRHLRPVSASAEPVGGERPHPGRAVAPHRHRDGVVDRDPGLARGGKAHHPRAQCRRPPQDQRLSDPGRRRAGEGADGLRRGRQQAREQGPQHRPRSLSCSRWPGRSSRISGRCGPPVHLPQRRTRRLRRNCGPRQRRADGCAGTCRGRRSKTSFACPVATS